MKKLRNLVKREEGLESGEYALLGLLILLVVIAGVTALGTTISNAYERIAALF
jgi:Flp pilus assembly pilin Flp